MAGSLLFSLCGQPMGRKRSLQDSQLSERGHRHVHKAGTESSIIAERGTSTFERLHCRVEEILHAKQLFTTSI